MSVLGLGMTLCVMVMQTVMILMAVTGVSAGQDSREMDTTVQVRSWFIKASLLITRGISDTLLTITCVNFRYR